MHYIYSTHLLHDAMRGLDTAHKQQMMNNVLGYVSSMLLNNTRSISCSPICAISMSIIPENDVLVLVLEDLRFDLNVVFIIIAIL